MLLLNLMQTSFHTRQTPNVYVPTLACVAPLRRPDKPSGRILGYTYNEIRIICQALMPFATMSALLVSRTRNRLWYLLHPRRAKVADHGWRRADFYRSASNQNHCRFRAQTRHSQQQNSHHDPHQRECTGICVDVMANARRRQRVRRMPFCAVRKLVE